MHRWPGKTRGFFAMVAVIPDAPPQSLLEIGSRAEPQVRLRPRHVGQSRAAHRKAPGSIARLQVRAQDHIDRRNHFVQTGRPATSDVVDFAAHPWCLRRKQIGVHHVIHVDKILSVAAIARDGRLLAGEHGAEDLDNLRRSRSGLTLSGPEHVEIAQPHRLQSEHGRKGDALLFAAQLRERIGRKRQRWVSLDERLGAHGTVYTLARRVHDTLAPALRAAARTFTVCVAHAHRLTAASPSYEACEGIARWNTYSAFWAAWSRIAGSFRSLHMIASRGCPAGKCVRAPVLKSSSTRTCSPSRSSASTRCDPTNPAPPVTRQIAIGCPYLRNKVSSRAPFLELHHGGMRSIQGSSAGSGRSAREPSRGSAAFELCQQLTILAAFERVDGGFC